MTLRVLPGSLLPAGANVAPEATDPITLLNHVKQCLMTIFSFETPFVLFMFAGIYKSDPRLAWFPVDLTAFFAALSVVVGAAILARRRRRFAATAIYLVAAYLAFAGYATLSLLWTPSSFYGPQKVLALVSLVAWSLIGSALLIADDRERLARFARLLRLLGLAVALEALWSLAHFRLANGGDGGVVEHYLASGRLFAAGAIVCVVGAVAPSGRGLWRLFDFAALGAFLALMLALGGRGPFLALIIVLGAALATGIRRSREHVVAIRWPVALLAGLLGALLVVVVALVLSGNQELTTVRRLSLLLSEGGGSSASIRMYYYTSAWRTWWDRPLFGYGIGSWPMMAYHIDERNYPHNIVLETLAELGMVGLALLAVVFGIALSRLRPRAAGGSGAVSTVAWLLLLSTFLNALVSGDYADNRFMFAALGLVAGGGSLGTRSSGAVEDSPMTESPSQPPRAS